MPEIMVVHKLQSYISDKSESTYTCLCMYIYMMHATMCVVYTCMYVYSMKIKVHLYWAMEVDDLKQRVVATSKHYHYQVHLHVYYSSYKITGVFINGVFFVNI